MNGKWIELSICGALVFGVISAQAVTLDTDFESDVKLTSEYLWRGKVVSDDWCVQPSFTASAGGFSVYLWGTWDMTSVSNASERTRVDATLEYSRRFDKVIPRAGFIAYIYKDSLVTQWKKDTYEAYAGCDVIALLGKKDTLILPSWTIYYDFSEIEGFYTTLGLRNSFELVGDKKWTISFDVRADVGAADENYNEKMFGFNLTDENGEPLYEPKASLVDLTADASFPISIGKHLTVTPAVRYMTLLDSKIKNVTELAGEDTDGFAYSLTVGATF